tara:strand:- start:132 stop:1007 length:876 start_codon:yes stop_codon:yes gene_type:complete
MSNVFNQNISNLGSAGVEKATQARNKYNQELTKREMISQTEESLGGIKLFTSGRELGSKILKDSKLKDYAKQQIDKALGKAKTAKPTKPTKPTETPTEEADLPDIPLPEIRTARSVTNDISDERLARIGRIAQNKKQSKIDRGMSEEDAEADRLNYIQGRVDNMTAKENLNNNLQSSNDAINEEAQSQFQAATEARANLKAAGKEKAQAKGKGKGDGDEEEVGGEEAAGEEGAEITGTEAAASVLDAIPGLDLLGAALGIGGLAAGFGKKPPKQINVPVSQASYSSQIGLS